MRVVHPMRVALLAAAIPWMVSGEETRIDVRVDRQEDGEWVEAPANQVFEHGDRVRFRFRASFDGFLYVLNRESGGGYELLFPRDELHRDHAVRGGEEYVIPGPEAWFQVEGPPGYEVTLWMVTPDDLGRKIDFGSFSDLPSEPGREAPPGDLKPRCDDKHLRTQGVCVDPRAGPRPLARSARLPPELDDLMVRDLRVEREGSGVRIYPKAPAGKTVIYEFRLAHN